MVEEEKLKEIAEDYGVGIETVKEYCDVLLSYPFVVTEDDSYFYHCLESLISEKTTQDFMAQDAKTAGARTTVLENVERCVYRVYGDVAIPFLSDKFKEENGIEEEEEKMGL